MAKPDRTDNHSYMEITRTPPSEGYIVRLQMSLPSLPRGMSPKEHPPISTAAVYAFFNKNGKYVPEPKDEAAAKKGGISTLPFLTVSGTDPRTVAQIALSYLAFRKIGVKQMQGNAESISLASLTRDKKKRALPPMFTPFGNDAFFGSIRAILHHAFASVLTNFKDLRADQLPYALSVDVTDKTGAKSTIQTCGASVDGTGETVLRKPCINGGPCKANGGGTCVLFKGGTPAGRLGVPVAGSVPVAAPTPAVPVAVPVSDAGLDDGDPKGSVIDFSTAPPPPADEPSEPAIDFNL